MKLSTDIIRHWILISLTSVVFNGCSPAMAYSEKSPGIPAAHHIVESNGMMDFERLADCIHRIENGTWAIGTGKGEQYGIHSVPYRDAKEAREICLRTIKRQWKREPGLEPLAKRYCPGNWKNWLRMVSFYLA